MTDPVTAFQASEYDELDAVFDEWLLEKAAGKNRSQRDLELWQRWDSGGRKPEDLEPLINQVQPVIRKAVNVWAGKVSVPRPAIEAEFEIHALNAIKKFDPSKSALHTYLTNQMKRGRRFVTTHQNVARIPENRVYRIGDFDRAKDRLTDELGREPSNLELADRLKWPVKQVATLEMEKRREIPTSMLQSDVVGQRVSQETELLRLLPAELSREENLVFENLTGASGKPMKAADIARKYNMSAAKVSRLRSSIADKVKKFYQG